MYIDKGQDVIIEAAKNQHSIFYDVWAFVDTPVGEVKIELLASEPQRGKQKLDEVLDGMGFHGYRVHA